SCISIACSRRAEADRSGSRGRPSLPSSTLSQDPETPRARRRRRGEATEQAPPPRCAGTPHRVERGPRRRRGEGEGVVAASTLVSCVVAAGAALCVLGPPEAPLLGVIGQTFK